MPFDPPSDDDQPPEQASQRATAAPPEALPPLPKPSRQLRASLAEHAAREAKRKAARRASRTPMRDDVARVALHATLRVMNKFPDDPAMKGLRTYTVTLLGRMGWDETRSAIALTDMLDRADIDRRAMLLKKLHEEWVANGCKGEPPYLKPALRQSEIRERKMLAEEKARREGKTNR